MELGLFTSFALIIIIAVALGSLFRLLRQPPLIGYVLAGILVGSQGLGIVPQDQIVGVFSQLGVAFLLFLVGIGLDPRVMREVGKVSVLSGGGQVMGTWIVGFGLCLLLGFSAVESLYISFALTLSSTIIVMKLLSDKNETETLHGRISMVILIFQDLAALLALLVVSSFGKEGGLAVQLAITLGMGVLLVLGLGVLAVYVLPRVLKFFASSQELLFLFCLGWVLLVSSLFHTARFSLEMGALLAGVALSMSPYRYEMVARVRPLRDFFILIFFILLGSQVGFSTVDPVSIGVLSLFVLIGNPAIVFLVLTYMGYTARTSFLTGLSIAQVSEFSFILMGLAVQVGHLSQSAASTVTTVGLITIAGSTFLIMHDQHLFKVLSRLLHPFQRESLQGLDAQAGEARPAPTIILFGYNRIGHDLLKVFRKMTLNILVVDYNPDTVRMLTRLGVPCRYGDANDRDLLEDIDLSRTRLACSTIPNEETSRILIHAVKRANRKAIFIGVAHQIDEALNLYKDGASYVLLPHFLGGSFAAGLIRRHGFASHKFRREKQAHLRHLKLRKQLGHEHPRISRHG